ncbi:amino acid adenylation domain-containing protein [Tenacibaculum singaporense]|uniref:amino acid adenylation domain-containing protein n=1 Tax=Tenacibaculum singaporense TaxID=2358479 RepID=UPI000F674BAD|nr:amino acid adenylation domain-containing protein [Tenacibaculum singaporense]RSC95138.1 amino acid adenylation domain-containing protein [Tenacibaculum singaporense]
MALLNNNDSSTTICELINKQTIAHPKRRAIIDGTTHIDYATLVKRSNEVAGELNNKGIKPGALVGVCMNRSWELVATLIGIMQAGCAYIPLDPAYPKDRIHYMLEHSRTSVVFVDSDITANLCNSVNELIQINTVGNYTDVTINTYPEDLAYVIYTSGSTGRPKGVAVKHKSIVSLVESMNELFTEEDLKGMVAAASVCFDTSVMEIIGTLSLGGTIILAKNALELTTLPAVDLVTMFVMVPSAVQAIISSQKLPKNLQCLVFGGEALKRSLVEQVYKQKPNLKVFNAYGPTEDTVYSTIAKINKGDRLITIGSSVPNSCAYILDEKLLPVTNGEIGELYLSGTKLAHGYLFDEELTKERFINVNIGNQNTSIRLYKTGDLCRWTPNNDIEFIGRSDQQVKIRGHRIELEEIEAVIETMEDIDTAAAIVTDGDIGQKVLVTYVIGNKNKQINFSDVKSFVAKHLPKYMIPQVVKQVEKLPLLPNDKLDRKKLANLSIELSSELVTEVSQHYQTPPKQHTSSNDYKEHLLRTIQNEVAKLLTMNNSANVLPDDSFDNLGIDSLTTLELSSRLSNVLQLDISAYDIFENPTPNALINHIIGSKENTKENKNFKLKTDTLTSFQTHIQSSHPTFQAAKVTAWSVNDKSKLVQEVLQMVNDTRRNPYSKVLLTGSATTGLVGDAYNDETQEAIIWTTNLYLGLNRDPEVIKEASISLEKFGTGMGTSAAASGMTSQHLEFEEEFADLVGKPSACLFPTGYTANVGAVAGLLGRNDMVLIDQLCHASIVDGARLCGAKVRTFKHNDAEDLESILQAEVSPYRSILVVLEGVYSMGEGAAPVAKIIKTAKKYNALTLVDEAHSFGFYGKGGAGICAAQGVTEEADFIMTTLSKALGSLGGVVAASKEHIDLLKSSSRAYIFQASISPADMAAALTALRRLRKDDALRQRLWDTTYYMRQKFEEAGYDLGTGDGPIVTPHFENKDKLYAIVQELYKLGIQTSAVTYPIVESGRGRLRLICSAAHTREDVDKTLAALIKAEREVDILLEKQQKDKRITTVSFSELENWAKDFSHYLKTVINENTPNLAIELKNNENTDTISILLKDNKITLNHNITYELPTCSLLISEKDALDALESFNIQDLLHTISNGSCTLKGQIEPFVWLIGRISEYDKATVLQVN